MNTNQEERPTPRTDAHQKLDHMAHDHLWSDFARTLERELTEKAEDNSRLAGLVLDAKRELAEVRDKINRQAERIRYLEGATNHANGTPLTKATKERDDALTALAMLGDKHERELAEAREGEASETRLAAQYKRERDESRERRDRLATELRGISEVTADAWDLKFSEFVSEFLPWAQNRCRAALAAVKGGSNE